MSPNAEFDRKFEAALLIMTERWMSEYPNLEKVFREDKLKMRLFARMCVYGRCSPSFLAHIVEQVLDGTSTGLVMIETAEREGGSPYAGQKDDENHVFSALAIHGAEVASEFRRIFFPRLTESGFKHNAFFFKFR